MREEKLGRVIVSGEGKIRIFDVLERVLEKETVLEGSGALCAGGESIFCASDTENAIYRLQRETLLPQSVYAGGPGMRALCLSPDRERLFVLLADADSVLMLGAQNGMPLRLMRAGIYPQGMKLDDTGERLVIAGGKDGCVHVLCAKTLRLIARYQGSGFCADASLRAGRVHALRMREGESFAVAGRLVRCEKMLLMIDALNERLYARDAMQRKWALVCEGARDAALL